MGEMSVPTVVFNALFWYGELPPQIALTHPDRMRFHLLRVLAITRLLALQSISALKRVAALRACARPKSATS
jgi:hypothetical protein